ncbi:probable pectate lyase 4, partial [Tanacetum coccineum]
YINYNCYLHPVGLRHGISEHLHPVGLHHELKGLDLPFGSNFTLSLRDELLDMEGCNLKHSVPEILVTHEMDEAYLVIDEAPQPNIHAEVKSTCYSDHSDSEITGLDHLEPHVEKKEPVWIVFEVLGSIKLASYLNVSSYKTIDGQGQRIKFTSKGLRLKECEHVIVCNLEFKGGRGRDVDAIKIKRNSK